MFWHRQGGILSEYHDNLHNKESDGQQRRVATWMQQRVKGLAKEGDDVDAMNIPWYVWS